MSNHMPHAPDLTGSPELSLFTATYEEVNNEILSQLDLVEPVPSWEEKVTDVIVVLCASRSGSSLIFNALASTGEVAAPAGEHEPWLALTENKFPFTKSDAIEGDINERAMLLKLIRNDLLVREGQVTSLGVSPLLNNRYQIRRQVDDPHFKSALQRLTEVGRLGEAGWMQLQSVLGNIASKPFPTEVIQFRDSSFSAPIENPPYIEQPLARLATDNELENKPLLFKSPSDTYRAGLYENLFPNARTTYIHQTRGFAQTVNGLMDGWQKNDIDFISNPVGVLEPLRIQDYSITDMTRAYWCFDLFPGWETFTDRTLLEVCTQQWVEAHRHTLEKFKLTSHLTFEQFYSDPDGFYAGLSEQTGIDTTGYDWSHSIMSTETPSQYRWKKRESIFRKLGSFLPGSTLKEVVELQVELGYTMEEETWC